VVLLAAGAIHQQQHECMRDLIKSKNTQLIHTLHPTLPKCRNILPLPKLNAYSFLVHHRRKGLFYYFQLKRERRLRKSEGALKSECYGSEKSEKSEGYGSEKSEGFLRFCKIKFSIKITPNEEEDDTR
ncbi:hypothetical protein S83_023177, partial [Arachis hypogaea]